MARRLFSKVVDHVADGQVIYESIGRTVFYTPDSFKQIVQFVDVLCLQLKTPRKKKKKKKKKEDDEEGEDIGTIDSDDDDEEEEGAPVVNNNNNRVVIVNENSLTESLGGSEPDSHVEDEELEEEEEEEEAMEVDGDEKSSIPKEEEIDDPVPQESRCIRLYGPMAQEMTCPAIFFVVRYKKRDDSRNSDDPEMLFNIVSVRLAEQVDIPNKRLNVDKYKQAQAFSGILNSPFGQKSVSDQPVLFTTGAKTALWPGITLKRQIRANHKPTPLQIDQHLIDKACSSSNDVARKYTPYLFKHILSTPQEFNQLILVGPAFYRVMQTVRDQLMANQLTSEQFAEIAFLAPLSPTGIRHFCQQQPPIYASVAKASSLYFHFIEYVEKRGTSLMILDDKWINYEGKWQTEKDLLEQLATIQEHLPAKHHILQLEGKPRHCLVHMPLFNRHMAIAEKINIHKSSFHLYAVRWDDCHSTAFKEGFVKELQSNPSVSIFTAGNDSRVEHLKTSVVGETKEIRSLTSLISTPTIGKKRSYRAFQTWSTVDEGCRSILVDRANEMTLEQWERLVQLVEENTLQKVTLFGVPDREFCREGTARFFADLIDSKIGDCVNFIDTRPPPFVSLPATEIAKLRDVQFVCDVDSKASCIKYMKHVTTSTNWSCIFTFQIRSNYEQIPRWCFQGGNQTARPERVVILSSRKQHGLAWNRTTLLRLNECYEGAAEIIYAAGDRTLAEFMSDCYSKGGAPLLRGALFYFLKGNLTLNN